jgi:phospholipase C
LPFEHVVVVMMENHSFDNLLGALPVNGQPLADGLTFRDGKATDRNPTDPGLAVQGEQVYAFPLATTEQRADVSQAWNATHEQVDGGSMQGFVRSALSTQPMGYYTPKLLPFSYWLANTFAVANRWFCSAPCQTYPNRRFLLAATAYGDIATTKESLEDPPPPNGTIFDVMHQHGVSWRNYVTDVPGTMVIPTIIERYWENIRSLVEFQHDCKAGTLPSVSFVDPGLGLLTDVGKFLAGHKYMKLLGDALEPISGSEEAPQDVAFGERWAFDVIRLVIDSPVWPRTLLIYTYDEHGGYYDHVPPPAAIPPDAIKPNLAPGDAPGGYDIYGPRVPAIVVSPYSRAHAVSNTEHDHTSILATIEAKWNLPALTHRDANANPVWDLLDLTTPALLRPPRPKRPRGMLVEAILDLLRIPRPIGGLSRPRLKPGKKSTKGGRSVKLTAADDPVDKYKNLVSAIAASHPIVTPAELEQVIADLPNPHEPVDEQTALVRHVAATTPLTETQAAPVVASALQGQPGEGAPATAADKASAVSQAVSSAAGLSADIQLSSPVMLKPWARLGFAVLLAVALGACIDGLLRALLTFPWVG